MKIAICGSLDHYQDMLQARIVLEKKGHEIFFPHTAQKMLDGKTTLDEVNTLKADYSKDTRERKHGLMKKHMEKIRKSDAVLVINLEKKGISNYIGGNTFLEMGFAVAFGKKIYVLNPIPEISYKDELTGMLPIVLNGDVANLD